MNQKPLLEVRNLTKHFPLNRGLLAPRNYLKAVDGVSFTLRKGETLGVVGESGCGKSTLGRTVLRLHTPGRGQIIFDGQDISGLRGRDLKPLRRKMQIIFQDPFASLNPRMTVLQIIREPLDTHKVGSKASRRDRVMELLELVGLRPQVINRYPHEFSGGQRQRIGIARALALNPSLIVADEPVSALDVSVQAQVLNLIGSLQKRLGLSFIFIAHDVAVVQHISQSVAVMYLGKIVEKTSVKALYNRPRHPYTKALLAAVPDPDPFTKKERLILTGDVPSPINPPPGCSFQSRCPLVQDRCRCEVPELRDFGREGEEHLVRCHFTE